jgi:hypothetical protein
MRKKTKVVSFLDFFVVVFARFFKGKIHDEKFLQKNLRGGESFFEEKNKVVSLKGKTTLGFCHFFSCRPLLVLLMALRNYVSGSAFWVQLLGPCGGASLTSHPPDISLNKHHNAAPQPLPHTPARPKGAFKKKTNKKRPKKTFLRRLWTCHRTWAPAAGCGVFIYELVPSDNPFMWCLCETIVFEDVFIFQRTFFYFLRKIN